jgi:hypothetical protein
MNRWPRFGAIVLLGVLLAGRARLAGAQAGELRLGLPVATTDGVVVEVLLAAATPPVTDLQFDVAMDSTAARVISVLAGPAADNRQVYSSARANGRLRVALVALDTMALAPGAVIRLLLQARNAAAAVGVTVDSAIGASAAGAAVPLIGCQAVVSLTGAQARLTVGDAVIAGVDSAAVPVALDAQGVAFPGLIASLRFDASQLRYLRVRSAQGGSGAAVSLSANAPAPGRVDVRVAAPQGFLPSGTLWLVEVAPVPGAVGGAIGVAVDSVRALTGGVVPVLPQAGTVYARVPAASTWNLAVVPPAAVPGRVEVPVTLAGVGPALADLQFDLSYPAADLQLRAVVAGPAATLLDCVPQFQLQAAGVARVVLPNLTRGTFAAGELVRLVFTLSGHQGNGARPLTLLNAVAGDLSGHRVNIALGTGTIMVSGAALQVLPELWVDPGPLARAASTDLGVMFHSAGQTVCDLQFDLLHPPSVAVQGARLGAAAGGTDIQVYYHALGPRTTRVVLTGLGRAALPDGRLLELRLGTVRAPLADSVQLSTAGIVASGPQGGAVPVIGRGTTLAVLAAPRAWTLSSALDLGTARLGGSGSSGSFWLHNPGSAALVVAALALKSDSFSASSEHDTVAAGDSMQVALTFRPQRAGATQDDLMIYSNSVEGGAMAIRLTGWATGPQLDFGPDSLIFGRCALGVATTRRLVLASTGTDSLRLSALNLGPGVFGALAGPLPVRLAAGDSLVVRVSFAPSASGDYAGQLQVVSDDPLRPQIEIALRGQAFDPAVEGDVEYRLDAGWNLLGTPLPSADPAALFPAARSIFAYDADRGYYPAGQLQSGSGYWVNLPEPRAAAAHGTWAGVAWTLPAGWSLVSPGHDTVEVAALRCRYPAFSAAFEFDGMYQVPERFVPGRGYWVHVDQATYVTPDSGATAARLVAANRPWVDPDHGGADGRLWVRSGLHRVGLQLGVPPSRAPGLPPPPPPGAMDARVRVGDRDTWGVPDGDAAAEFALRLQGADLELTWEVAPESPTTPSRWQLVLADRVVALAGRGRVAGVTAPFSVAPTVALLRRLPRLPAITRLAPNYPNPFNPTTTLRYDLAQTGPVSLRVYSATGQLVRELVAAQQMAGRYQVGWDGRDGSGVQVGSGLYLAVLQAGTYRCINRMVLIE